MADYDEIQLVLHVKSFKIMKTNLKNAIEHIDDKYR